MQQEATGANQKTTLAMQQSKALEERVRKNKFSRILSDLRNPGDFKTCFNALDTLLKLKPTVVELNEMLESAS